MSDDLKGLSADVPPVLGVPAIRLVSLTPDRFIWWNEEEQERIPGPQYACPRFPLQADWKNTGTDLTELHFPEGVVHTHDIIEPNQPDQNTAAVYPRSLELVEQSGNAAPHEFQNEVHHPGVT